MFATHASAPLTDTPPPMVYPDTPEAREAVEYKHPTTRDLFTFCRHYRLDRHPVHPDGYLEVHQPCANRRLESPTNNWCYRCIVGFPVTTKRVS